MTVNEKVARLWGKLRGRAPARNYIPDPAEQPWEWVKVLRRAGWSISLETDRVQLWKPIESGHSGIYRYTVEEPALVAAIDKMAEDSGE